MRIRIRILFDADADPVANPGYQNDADPCGSRSGSTTLVDGDGVGYLIY
jgi:hypothetical protein